MKLQPNPSRPFVRLLWYLALFLWLPFLLLGLDNEAWGTDKLTFAVKAHIAQGRDLIILFHYLPIVAGENKGFWKGNGLDISFMPYQSTEKVIGAVASGSAQVGLGETSAFMLWAEESPLIFIAQLAETENMSLWVQPTGPIKQISDLKGRKIGVLGTLLHSAYARHLAKSLGLAPKDFKLVSVLGRSIQNMVKMLKEGELDAVLSFRGNFARYRDTEELREFLLMEEHLPKPWPGQVAFVTKEFADKNPDLVKRLAKGFAQSTNFLQANSAWVVDKIVRGRRTPNLSTAKTLESMLKFSKDGKISSQGVKNIQGFLTEYGLAKKKQIPEVSQIVWAGALKPEERQEKLPTPKLWAVVVGIGRYKDTRIPGPKYASKDAQAFYDFILSPQGGGYKADQVRLLLNEQATRVAIESALGDFLKEAKKEDLVTIYFAGHGTPEPGRTDEMYILPYDAKLASFFSTAIPMDRISNIINKRIYAERVVFIADSCHAGQIGSSSFSFRSLPEVSDRFYTWLSTTRKGLAIFTASGSMELSVEGEEWGGGHGVFTYYLLEGLKGAANRDDDGIVTVREAFDYAYRKVAKDTKNNQHPELKGSFDNNIPLAVLPKQ